MRTLAYIALLGALVLAAGGVAVAVVGHESDIATVDNALRADATAQADAIDNYFTRSRDITLIAAQNGAFTAFYNEVGDVKTRRGAKTAVLAQVAASLAYLENLYPDAIGEACFIDAGGPEVARVVKGEVAPVVDLSDDESQSTFFKPTFDGAIGSVYQAKPYLSPDTGEWVISNSTPVAAPDGTKLAIAHFEVSIESFRKQAARGAFRTLVVDRESGAIVIDTALPQKPKVELGAKATPATRRLVAAASATQGSSEIDGKRASYAAIAHGDGNANDWVLVTVSTNSAAFGLDAFGLGSWLLLALALAALGFAVFAHRTANRQRTERATARA